MVKPVIVGAHYGFSGLARPARHRRGDGALHRHLRHLRADAARCLLRELAWPVSAGFMKFATFLFFMSLFYHAWIGA